MGFLDNIKHGWNAFRDQSTLLEDTNDFSTGTSFGISGQSANFLRGYRFNKSDLIKSVITRIALDATMVDIQHLKINENDGSQTKVDSGLINALTMDANIDQTGFSFRFDLFWSMLDEGCIAAVPVTTDSKPTASGAYDISTMRVGKVMQWYPKQVRVRLYNENTGTDQDIIIDKKLVAIIESPLYSLLQEGNQTLRLLQAKINRMNSEDSNAASGKLNGFLKVAYATKNTTRKDQADKRRAEIEGEMAKSKFGLATLDVTEQYIPAGAGLTNNLLDDIRKLQQDFYNQTGMTEKILDGTADEKEMLNYYNRTIDPIISATLAEFNRKFLTKTARSQGQVLSAFRDPFKLVPVDQLAQIADIFTRNAILTPNEIRKFIGKEPHPDPTANQLFNRNIADGNQAGGIDTVGQGQVPGQATPGAQTQPSTPAPTAAPDVNNLPEVPDFLQGLQQSNKTRSIKHSAPTPEKRKNYIQGSKNYMVRSKIDSLKDN